MGFLGVQCFYVDSKQVFGAIEVGLSRIDLFCLGRPDEEHNCSGIRDPGVTITLVPTANTIPVLDNFDACPKAHLEFTQCRPDRDALIPSVFRFEHPIPIATDTEWAFVIQHDGDEDFRWWGHRPGANICGTATPAPEFPGTFRWFPSLTCVPLLPSNVSVSNTPQIGVCNTIGSNNPMPNTEVCKSWLPLSGYCLKHQVFVARYAFNGNTDLDDMLESIPEVDDIEPQVIRAPGMVTNSNGSDDCTVTLPANRCEYIVFDKDHSLWTDCSVGEWFHRRAPFWRREIEDCRVDIRCSISEDSDLIILQTGYLWEEIFTFTTTVTETIVVWSLDHFGLGKHRIQVRRVVERVSDTVIRIDSPCNITNASCKFHKAAVARLEKLEDTNISGNHETMLRCRDSNANDDVRFANDCIEDIDIIVGGTGFSNTDHIEVWGFEDIPGIIIGGHPCKANVVTDGGGVIIEVHITNTGCGFINVAALDIRCINSIGQISVGSGHNLHCNVGTTVFSEFLGLDGSGGVFKNCRLEILEAGEICPGIIINQPHGCFYNLIHRLVYYSRDDDDFNNDHNTDHHTHRGRMFFCDSDDDAEFIDVKHRIRCPTYNFKKRRCLPSWSHEHHICYEGNGSPCFARGGDHDGDDGPFETSNCSVVVVKCGSNSDFIAPHIDTGTTTVAFSKFVINDDETGENTNYGNAMARGVESKVYLANGQVAEDFLAYATVYRPSNTDVEVYVKFYNSADSDSFDDKDWTRLEQDSSVGLFSTTIDPTACANADTQTPASYVTAISNAQPNNWIEVTYGLSAAPNTVVLAGTATTSNASYTITGSGTSWSTNATINLHAGDLVMLSQSLFPQDYMISVVNVISSDTSFTISDPVTNNGIISSGMTVAKVLYPHQVFLNGLNSNVARYYNSTMAPYDTFDTFQVKIVMLAADERIVPAVDDFRATALSA